MLWFLYSNFILLSLRLNCRFLQNAIDLAFIGINTSLIQANLSSQFKYSEVSAERNDIGFRLVQIHELDFDAAAGFPANGFKWTPEYIEKFADERKLRTVRQSDKGLRERVHTSGYSPLCIITNARPVTKVA